MCAGIICIVCALLLTMTRSGSSSGAGAVCIFNLFRVYASNAAFQGPAKIEERNVSPDSVIDPSWRCPVLLSGEPRSVPVSEERSRDIEADVRRGLLTSPGLSCCMKLASRVVREVSSQSVDRLPTARHDPREAGSSLRGPVSGTLMLHSLQTRAFIGQT